jgi:hypothetical protein
MRQLAANWANEGDWVWARHRVFDLRRTYGRVPSAETTPSASGRVVSRVDAPRMDGTQ